MKYDIRVETHCLVPVVNPSVFRKFWIWLTGRGAYDLVRVTPDGTLWVDEEQAL